jgi:hypothetical protein
MQGEVSGTTKFQAVRESIPASREAVIRRTKSLSVGTVRNVESGCAVRKSTALELWRAINSLLEEAGMSAIQLEDLELRLRVDRRAPAQEPVPAESTSIV